MTADEPSTILVVEDDDATRTFLADNLTADGFDLLVADCARDGLRLLESKFPDLVLVDLGLPDASGFEIVRRVREADGIASRVDPRTPLVVVSGRTSELDRVRGFDRGCDDYVGKASRSVSRGRTARRAVVSESCSIPAMALSCSSGTRNTPTPVTAAGGGTPARIPLRKSSAGSRATRLNVWRMIVRRA
jgi:CheY-like chemotaxis protein